MKLTELKNNDLREATLNSVTKSTDGVGYVLNEKDIKRGLEIEIEYCAKEINGAKMEMTFCDKGENDTVCVFFINGSLKDKYYNEKANIMFAKIKG